MSDNPYLKDPMDHINDLEEELAQSQQQSSELTEIIKTFDLQATEVQGLSTAIKKDRLIAQLQSTVRRYEQAIEFARPFVSGYSTERPSERHLKTIDSILTESSNTPQQDVESRDTTEEKQNKCYGLMHSVNCGCSPASSHTTGERAQQPQDMKSQ